MPQTQQPKSQSESETQPKPESQPLSQPAPTVARRIESKFPRGLIIRLVAYLFVGHLFAFFVYLLFVLGAENQ
ncbi:DUF6126 family protein [Streptomyces sp. H34-S4]|uniref:DUF6126 family protein n=1 Tax=Streptomyces sp. H34-S4 TaxID=2996463 RepID=UPI002D1E473A|nr:DUF6126 family protein [Streptomyces sp. H34-S4]